MSFVDPLHHIAKQLFLQKGLQASSFIDQLVQEGLVSSDEAGRLKGVALRESINGWRSVLSFLRNKDPSRAVEAMQSLIGKEDALSRDVLSRLQHLWISGDFIAMVSELLVIYGVIEHLRACFQCMLHSLEGLSAFSNVFYVATVQEVVKLLQLPLIDACCQ